jgi:uncharacterized ferredoxin-like protein
MPIIENEKCETEGLRETGRLMMIAARTAPKSGGIDDVETLMIYGEEKEKIVEEMKRIGDERESPRFYRDAKNVSDSDLIILIGVNAQKNFGINCGSCGYQTCKEFNTKRVKGIDFEGPSCSFKLLDLGIAIGSAVKTAGTLNVDNRIMYRIATAAQRLGFLKKSTVSMGIPLSAKGKNIYYDRKE